MKETALLREVPDIAARIQDLAPRGVLIVRDRVHRVVAERLALQGIDLLNAHAICFPKADDQQAMRDFVGDFRAYAKKSGGFLAHTIQMP